MEAPYCMTFVSGSKTASSSSLSLMEHGMMERLSTITSEESSEGKQIQNEQQKGLENGQVCRAQISNEYEPRNTKAMMRWRMLKKFLLSKQYENTDSETPSVTRCISSFGLIERKEVKQPKVAYGETIPSALSRHKWMHFSLKKYGSSQKQFSSNFNELSIEVRVKTETTMKDLEIADKDNVDNTGNICVWPSEEILAFYSVYKLGAEFFNGKRVLEIGCGIGVAGLMIAKAFPCIKEIVLTDGNASVVENLRCNINHLVQSGDLIEEKISCSQLLWQSTSQLEMLGKFDILLAADCLFFEEYHNDLMTLLEKSAEKVFGHLTVIMFNPKRGKSLENFVSKFQHQSQACIQINENYDENIFNTCLRYEKENAFFSKDNHYPLLMEIKF
ncbi:hypothetical protein C9374_003179 [Naegleria lovaniensis]|uniref:Calmodulin-lysine N-methyltransferase n=1 Tax=Naegleria lovaniensis TaxID=51637 RepID=A0AA88GNK3_NAELO|nr:uncharacterized protein C9374_003179 [Naegleria lovaniensis]KAG2386030.1 hypothetical protein C9374_003179 [Naegleria lovaniensis]